MVEQARVGDAPAKPPLAGIRVIDLATPLAELAGRMLADLGAEVLKVEPPSGARARRRWPLTADGRSLYWACVGAGKSACRLDLDVPADRDRLRALVAGADVLIESFPPGYMAARELDHARLQRVNPGLVYLAVSPYGQHGPKAHWPGTDLTVEAAGGRLLLQGDADRTPLPIGFPQASLHAGAQGAADIVVALNERAASGRGQFLDLSMSETMFWTLMGVQGRPACGVAPAPAAAAATPVLAAARQVLDRLTRPLRAADGCVAIGPGGIGAVLAALTRSEAAAGRLPGELAAVDWLQLVPGLTAGRVQLAHLEAAATMLEAFVGSRSQVEMVQFAHAHDLRLGPFYTARSLLADPHYNARDFFIERGPGRQPGPWARLTRTPLSMQAPAPDAVGQPPPWSPRPPVPAASVRGDAFVGLKVADFSWVAAGPTIGKALADHGATVVKVESGTRLDLSRTLPPFLGGAETAAAAGPNRSYWSCLYMTSKLSLTCNLSVPEGRDLARRVIDWADVVIESFSPGTMQRFGLDYATVACDRDDLIMLSTSLLGQTGPLRTFAGFGQQGAGFSGHHAITGWPDRVPSGVYAPYTDVVAPKFGIAALAAAVLERRGSGRGQYIDLAQAEASMHFIAPLVLDADVTGRVAGPAGLAAADQAPHGVWPVAGERRFIAIAVETTEQWHALCALAPLAAFAAVAFDDLAARQGARDAIDAALGQWLLDADGGEMEQRLCEAGVPAALLCSVEEYYGDPQVRARGFLQTLPHGAVGEAVIYGFPTRFSAKKQMVLRSPPCLGEHNDFVLRELLALDADAVARYQTSGALS